MRRCGAVMAGVLAALMATPSAALACGGLIGPNGAVRLLRTSTLAGYVDGVEHYVTSFTFGSAEESFGSIIPLPGVPTDVRRGGDWTLQRLAQEVAPPVTFASDAAGAEAASGRVEVLLETRIDALDVTVLRGGGQAVTD